jgi:fructose-1,6-bisphosphatase/inositol monophosphatase family enzyme
VTPTPEFLDRANTKIRATLMELRPQLLETSGKIEHRLKADKSAVTEMDLLVEHRLHEALATLDPDIGLCGEETGADYDQETFWLVDPIDGTEPFIRGLPFATNMIALIHKGEPIMSVIYNFNLDEYFHAVKGQGATKNGHPIHVIDRPLKNSYVYCSPKTNVPHQHGMIGRLRSQVASTPSYGAAGYLLTVLASGSIDGAIYYGTRSGEWDTSPGALLVKEAGGRVENYFSDKYDFRNTAVLYSAPGIFDELKAFAEAEITAAKPAD